MAPGFSHEVVFQHRDVAFRPRVNNRGGGRGYLATRDIAPGTLLLSEHAVAEIPDFPEDRDPAERCILHLASGAVDLDKAKAALSDLALLHPRSVAEIDADRKKAMQPSCSWLAAELAEQPLTKDLNLSHPDVLLQALCALHFNGFVTGVYVYLAMINHSCVPNCVKWGTREGQDHSEVRATRFIRAGEEITINYLVPALRSRVARQRALVGQFGFQCTCDLCEGKCNAALEDVPGVTPVGLSQTLEDELEDLEENELGRNPIPAHARALAARKAATDGGLGPRHLALARTDMMIAETALEMLDEGGGNAKKAVDAGLVLQLLRSSLSLRQTQVLFFREGVPDYADLRARVAGTETRSEAEPTLHHIASAIGFFVARGMAKDVLLGLRLDDEENGELVFKSVEDAIACQLSCERVSRSIADLYQ